MPLHIIRNDITKVECDAIVNAANNTLLGGGGVDGAIHKAAGSGLLEECRKLGGCKTGQAKITGGYNLPCKYVIHTVGPVWRGGGNNERRMLESCYKNPLALAKEYKCGSVAFPLISAGVYGYPADEAFEVAVETIAQFLMKNDMTVYLVIYGKNAFRAGSRIFSDIAAYIDDNYVDENTDEQYELMRQAQCSQILEIQKPGVSADKAKSFENPKMSEQSDQYEFNDISIFFSQSDSDIKDIIGDMLDESFSQMLLRKIDEKQMKDSECYKKANIDKRLFSKIRSNPGYRPTKTTVLAFCVALELSLDETNEMLMKAGFALSHSSKLDIIVEYFIKNRNYNIFEINEVLFAFDQSLLGSVN